MGPPTEINWSFWCAARISCAAAALCGGGGWEPQPLDTVANRSRAPYQAPLLEDGPRVLWTLQRPLGTPRWLIALWRDQPFWRHLQARTAPSPLLIRASIIGSGPEFVKQGAERPGVPDSLVVILLACHWWSNGSGIPEPLREASLRLLSCKVAFLVQTDIRVGDIIGEKGSLYFSSEQGGSAVGPCVSSKD